MDDAAKEAAQAAQAMILDGIEAAMNRYNSKRTERKEETIINPLVELKRYEDVDGTKTGKGPIHVTGGIESRRKCS